MKRNHRAKVDLIVLSDDDSPSTSPARKAKREEDDPPSDQSREIAELKQKVAKLEKDRQGAILIAGEAQERVEHLERMIDSKRGSAHGDNKVNVVAELQKKVTSLTQQLDAERSRASEERKRERAHASVARRGRDVQPHDEINRELERKLAEVTVLLADTSRQLEDAKAKKEDAVNNAFEKAHELFNIKLEIVRFQAQLTKIEETARHDKEELQRSKEDKARDQQRIAELTRKLDEAEKESQLLKERIEETARHDNEELQKAKEDKARDQQRINELTRKLDDSEKESQLLKESVDNLTLQVKEWQQKAEENQSRESDRVKVLATELKTKAADWKERLDEFVSELDGKSDQNGPKAVHPTNIFQSYDEGTPDSIPFDDALEQLRALYFPQCSEWKNECKLVVNNLMLECETCDRSLKNINILSHFFTAMHSKAMRAHKASISRTAFEHWLRKLQSIRKPAAGTVLKTN